MTSTPILSTTDRGARMTQLEPGQRVGRLSPGLVLTVLVGIAAWALVSSVPYAALLGLAPTPSASNALGSPWAVVAAVVVAYVALLVTSRVHTAAASTFGQGRVAGLLSGLTVLAGGSVGAIGWTVASYAHAPTPAFDLNQIAESPEIPRELGVVLGGLVTLWALLILVRLVPGVRKARSRQQSIDRLRRTGTRLSGTLTDVVFRNSWLWDRPEFKLTVGYTDGGVSRSVLVNMRTDAERVPVLGSPMIVFSDGTGVPHVELDTEAGVQFEQEYARFTAPQG